MFKGIKTLLKAVCLGMCLPAAAAAEAGEGAPASEAAADSAADHVRSSAQLDTGATPENAAAEVPAGEAVPGAQIAGLEHSLKAKEARIRELEEQAASTAAANASRVTQLEAGLKQAAAGYRNLLISANPDILPELITGDSLADLDSSLAKARQLTGRITENLAARAALNRIPVGAPVRSANDARGLSPREKIRRGLGD